MCNMFRGNIFKAERRNKATHDIIRIKVHLSFDTLKSETMFVFNHTIHQ